MTYLRPRQPAAPAAVAGGPALVGLPVPPPLAAALRGLGRLGVAYSGGVDSSVLLAAAVRTLGPADVVAILGISPSLAADEHREAVTTAAYIGATVVEIQTHEGERPEYRRNGPDRCFHCKDELFSRIDADLVRQHRLDTVAYGENADDVARVDRPGAGAATAHRVRRPLAEAGLDKAAVRRLARSWALPSADKPAAPCLASRIPHHQEVTPEKLGQIEAAEAALHRLGLADLRVRHHGDIARIELPVADLVRAVTDPLRRQIRRAVLAAGFRYATVDVGAMQSGSFTLTVLQRETDG